MWKPVLPSVWAINGAAPSPDRDVMAAVLYAGIPAAASHTSATWKLGLSGFVSTPVHVSTTGPRRPNGLPIRIHRVDDLLVDHIVMRAGIPVTSPERTILDLAGCGHPFASRALDEALRKELTSLGDLWLMVEDRRFMGRRGIGRVRDMLIERTPDVAAAESGLEQLALQLLRRAGLPAPICQFPVDLPGGKIRIDLAYPEARLGIELDGFAFHHEKEAFEADRKRDIELGLLGWRIVRFTWPMLHYRPEFFVETVSHHLS
jgi:very-short-patch-repair endonuclease